MAGKYQIKEVNMLKSLLAVALLASAAAPALAAPAPSTPGTVTVSYADLDLGRAAGRAALARRVHRAVAALCHADRRGPVAQWMAVTSGVRVRCCVQRNAASTTRVSKNGGTSFANRRRKYPA